MRFKLLFGQFEIATIKFLEQDFLNLYGKYNLCNNYRKSHRLMKDYLLFLIEADKIMNEDEDKWLTFIEQNEPKFDELIESNDWKLIDENQNVKEILIPNFCIDNMVNWRWR